MSGVDADLDMIQRLQAVTATTLAHLPLQESLRALLERVCRILRAQAAVILLLTDDREQGVVQAAYGLEPGTEGARVRITDGLGACVAASGEPLIVDDLTGVEVVTPGLRDGRARSLLAAPLLVQGRVIGILKVADLLPRRFSAQDVRLLQIVANRAALALDHARMREVAEAARESVRVTQCQLASVLEAAPLLHSSAEYAATLANMARLAVRCMADWCAVDLVEAGGSVRAIARAHRDPAMEPVARELERCYPFDPGASAGLAQVLRTGRVELHRASPECLPAEGESGPNRMLCALGLGSWIITPLRVGPRVAGAISFARAKGGRPYSATDVAVAEHVARCAAAAVAPGWRRRVERERL